MSGRAGFQFAMSQMMQVATRIESAINSTQGVPNAEVRGFTRNDDGSVDLEVHVAPGEGETPSPTPSPDAKGSDGSTDASAVSDERDQDPLAAIGEQVGEVTHEQEVAEDRNGQKWGCECGETFESEKALQAHWGRSSGDSRSHGKASSGDTSDTDDQASESETPSGPEGYARLNGPCIATDGKGSGDPCPNGAHEDHAPFCSRHGRMSADPTVHSLAKKARANWDDQEVQDAYVDRHIGR